MELQEQMRGVMGRAQDVIEALQPLRDEPAVQTRVDLGYAINRVGHMHHLLNHSQSPLTVTYAEQELRRLEELIVQAGVRFGVAA